MDYKLKDKLTANKDFLTELIDKSWLEIEHLQTQIANIDNTDENTKLIQLFKNLLTNYYVFIGGLENLNSEEAIIRKPEPNKEPVIIEPPIEKAVLPEEPIKDDFFDDSLFNEPTTKDEEPFEYFVDFDDPIGDPLTDDDLYNS
jgi:hypothetical protein